MTKYLENEQYGLSAKNNEAIRIPEEDPRVTPLSERSYKNLGEKYINIETKHVALIDKLRSTFHGLTLGLMDCSFMILSNKEVGE